MIRSPLQVVAAVGALLVASAAFAQDQGAAPVPAPDASAPQAPPPGADPAQPPPAQTPPVDTAAPDMPPSPAPAPDIASPAQDSAAPTIAPSPASAPVQVQALSQLDLFSTGRDTGLGEDVWKGSSAEVARAVIPELAAKPLSPAASALARRLLAQTSTAPAGAGNDLDLAVARARALLALGDAEDAVLVLGRTPGVSDHAELAQLAAEAALISEQDDKACAVGAALTDGRDGLYWLRLRAFCQALAGKRDEAQLTFNLIPPPAKGQARDSTTARLLGIFVAGVGDPGPPSLRGGLEFALSRALKLDLAPALPTAALAISRRWALKNSVAAAPDANPAPTFVPEAIRGAASGTADPAVLDQLIDQAAKEPGPKSRARLQSAAAILASLGGEVHGAARASLAGFELGRADSAARWLALDTAAGAGLKGETILLALRIAETGGSSGPSPADRSWIIRALERVGLKADAQALAVEGLTALQ
jgi:hypothetical protein